MHIVYKEQYILIGENMQLIYLKNEFLYKEDDCFKLFLYFKKVIYKLRCLFRKIKFEKYDINKIICTLPYKEKINEKKAKKIVKKLTKKIKEKEIVFILSNGLEQEAELKRIILENNYKLLNGRWLFENLILNIVEYIAEKQGKKLQEYTVSILAKEGTRQNKEKIIDLARESKIS